jgi:hypothetical protein
MGNPLREGTPMRVDQAGAPEVRMDRVLRRAARSETAIKPTSLA